MTTKRHTLAEARAAKRVVTSATAGLRGVSVGIGQTPDGADYAVTVFVESEETVRQLPPLRADVPVQVTVTGPVKAY